MPNPLRPRASNARKHGFTLIELAVVLFIGTILLTAGLKLLTAQVDGAGYTTTRISQSTIKDALTSYLGRFGRLPCPDTDSPPDGIENRNSASPATCVRFFGTVPYATLELPREAAVDGWENYLGYGVSPRWTLTYSATPAANTPQTSIAANAFFVGVPGALTVQDRVPATNATPTVSTSGAVVVLVSYGRNGSGAVTFKGSPNQPPDPGTDELVNVNVGGGGTTYFAREYTDSVVPTYGAFDDVVRVISAADLTTPLAKDGALTSVAGSLNQSFAAMTDAVVGSAVASHTAPGTPYLLPGTLPGGTTATDPWGNAIVYAPAGALVSPGITATTSGPATAFQLTSYGPDGVSGGGDDVTYAVPLVRLQGIFAKTGF